MQVGPGLDDVAFDSSNEDCCVGELRYAVAAEAAAAADEWAHGFGWVVGFACAVKSFDLQADTAMRVAGGGRAGQSVGGGGRVDGSDYESC